MIAPSAYSAKYLESRHISSTHVLKILSSMSDLVRFVDEWNFVLTKRNQRKNNLQLLR